MAERENKSTNGEKSFVDWKVVAFVLLLLLALTGIISNTRNLFITYGQSASGTSTSAVALEKCSQTSNDESMLRQIKRQEQRGKRQEQDDTLPCLSNPYLGALEESIDEVMENMDTWLDNVGVHGVEATAK